MNFAWMTESPTSTFLTKSKEMIKWVQAKQQGETNKEYNIIMVIKI